MKNARLGILCFGVLMVVLDTTVVNIALPSIRANLLVSNAALVWVVNSYMITFGGFLLLGGRLSDLYGQRRLFLIGVAVFTGASFICGMAQSETALVMGRAIQGLGGAGLMAVALSMMMSLCKDDRERATAGSLYAGVCAAGGGVGLLVGGALTHMLGWHWVFLINVPIGVAILLASVWILPRTRAAVRPVTLDVWGATTVTVASIAAISGIVSAGENGWAAVSTVSSLGIASLAVLAFVSIERRVRAPLIPVSLWKLRGLGVSVTVRFLWSAATYGWFFISALYLQEVLQYDPIELGLAFLPANAITALCALGFSARLIRRFGFKLPLVAGLAIVCVGFAICERVPVDGSFVEDVLPSMVAIGVGGGIALNALLFASLRDVHASELGIASGLMNAAAIIGGAFGVTVLASLAAARTRGELIMGIPAMQAQAAGFHAAYAVAAGVTALAAALAWAFLRSGPSVERTNTLAARDVTH